MVKNNCKQPKRERVNAKDFAKGYVTSVGDKATALVKAKQLAEASKTTDLNTHNFWLNIVGHIGKI